MNANSLCNSYVYETTTTSAIWICSSEGDCLCTTPVRLFPVVNKASLPILSMNSNSSRLRLTTTRPVLKPFYDWLAFFSSSFTPCVRWGTRFSHPFGATPSSERIRHFFLHGVRGLKSTTPTWDLGPLVLCLTLSGDLPFTPYLLYIQSSRKYSFKRFEY